ncbi:MAG: hypothetical protein ACXQS8_00015 [Candidatus Helarchaeales archaeon]
MKTWIGEKLSPVVFNITFWMRFSPAVTLTEVITKLFKLEKI